MLGQIEFATDLDMHEKFLARLTVRNVVLITHLHLTKCNLLRFIVFVLVPPYILQLHLTYELLCRQVSSLNLLRTIAKEEKCTIEELNAGRVTDWFSKDVARRNEDPKSAVLKWDQ